MSDTIAIIAANALLGTKHIIAYIVVLVLVVAIVYFVMRNRTVSRY